MKRAARFMLLIVFLLATPTVFAQQVIVTPVETDELLANPDMGWETYDRNSTQDKNLPAWIPSTVRYSRWGWNELEPKQGAIDYGLIDKALKDSHACGQKLAMRVMCCSTFKGQPYHPAWLKEISGKELLADRENRYSGRVTYPLPIPDMDDPIVLNAHLAFIKRLGERYDGNPDLTSVDLGSIGWWGEWHLGRSKKQTLPSETTRMKVVKAYLAAFKKTPLLMLIAGENCLTYATEHGTGWRADCLGDRTDFDIGGGHMHKIYPAAIAGSHLQDTWKTAPIAWESCWDIQRWVDQGWPLRYTFNYALALHGSYINPKSAPLPPDADVRAEIERFLRRLGYRLVLKELQRPAEAAPGAKLELAMKWQNMGSAPCYRPYRVAYRLSDDKGYSKTFVGSVAVNHWLPGSIELFTEEFFKQPKDLPPGEVYSVADAIELPKDLAPGKYRLALAVVDPATSLPVVRLGIKGRTEDGWYPLGEVAIK